MPPTLRKRKATATTATPTTAAAVPAVSNKKKQSKTKVNVKPQSALSESDADSESTDTEESDDVQIDSVVEKQFKTYVENEEKELNGEVWQLKYWSGKSKPTLAQLLALPRVYLSPAAVKAFELEANRIEKLMSKALHDVGNIRMTSTPSSSIFLLYFTELLDQAAKIKNDPLRQFNLLFAMTIWAFDNNNDFWYMQTEEYLKGGLLAPFMQKLNRTWQTLLLTQDGYVLGTQSKQFLCEYLNEQAAKVKRGPEDKEIYQFKWSILKSQ